MLDLMKKSREPVVDGGADFLHRPRRAPVIDIQGANVRPGFDVGADVPVFPFNVDQLGPTVVITPLKSLLDLGSDELLDSDPGGAIRLLQSRQTRNVVINCQYIDRCNSSVVAFFVKLWKRSKASGGRMAFCNLSAHLRQLVEALCLNSIWPVFGSQSEAIAYVDGYSYEADVGRCLSEATRWYGVSRPTG